MLITGEPQARLINKYVVQADQILSEVDILPVFALGQGSGFRLNRCSNAGKSIQHVSVYFDSNMIYMKTGDVITRLIPYTHGNW